MDCWVICGSIGRFDAWNVFVCIFEDVKKSMLKLEIVIYRNYLGIVCRLSIDFRVPPTPSYGVCAGPTMSAS